MVPLRILRRTSSVRRVQTRGFTLVEMLVVLSIVLVLSTIMITGQSTFNRSLLLSDTAYTIAFSIREAQTLGLSSRVFSSVQNAGYGIRFDAYTPSSYIQFSDIYPASPGNSQSGICPGHAGIAGSPDARPGNCIYDPYYPPTVTVDELVRTYTLNRGFYVSAFCGTSAQGQKCSTTDFDTLDIVFMRPSTNAVIIGKRSSTLTQLSDAYIRLKSPDGLSERCIFVTKVGQVAVNACP